jgi:tetratricopeptide (TPR) repeat protein
MSAVPPIPPLAAGFVPRPETGHPAAAALVPGATVVLSSDWALSARLVAPATTNRVATGAREWSDSCGKTQLAISLATTLRAAGEADIVVWVAATSRASVLSAYGEAAAALGLVGGDNVEGTAMRLLGFLRDTSRPWLVILDDLREPQALDRLWPSGPGGRVLVTTTSSAAARPDGHIEPVVIPVGALSHRESLAYLMGRLTDDLDQRQGAADLVAELGGEPLALLQASAVIATSELSCRGYLDQFTARREQAPAGASPTAITWAMAVEQAELLAPAIAHAQLTFASLLDGDGMPYSAFTTSGRQHGIPDATLDEGLAALEAAGLLSVDRALDPPLVRMNWVVQTASLAASAGSMAGPVASAAASALLADWPSEDKPEWLARAFRSSADSLRRAAGDTLWQGGCHELLMRVGRSLDAIPAASAAVDYWGDLAAASDRLLGGDHPDTLAISGLLARAYLAAGRPDEAIAWFQWVRGDRLSRLGPDAPGTADALRDLGKALLAAGRAADAADTLTDAVAAYDHMAGSDSPGAMDTRDDLIAALRAVGKPTEAIWLGQQALANRQRVQGKRHPDTLATGLRLAEAYLADDHLKAAASLLKDVVSDREKVLGSRHPDTIAARALLASAHHATGKMASAVHLYEQVRTDYAQVLGGDHQLALTASLNLANALYAVGRQTDGAKLLRDTADRCELHLPAGDPIAAKVQESLRNVTGPAPTDPAPAPVTSFAARPAAAGEQRSMIGRRGPGRHRHG